uniref:Uncharacterized protein n=1 Tax=Brassica campestris TaxID=3711 RepID=M4DXU9_BRACM
MVQDNNGDMHDQEGHQRNAAGLHDRSTGRACHRSTLNLNNDAEKEHRPTLPTTNPLTLITTMARRRLLDCFTYEELLNMQKRDNTDQIQAESAWERTRSIDTRHQQSIDKRPQQSIDINNTTSIDNHSIPKNTVSEKDKFDNQYLTPDKFGIFRDPNFYAKAIDGRTLHERLDMEACPILVTDPAMEADFDSILVTNSR